MAAVRVISLVTGLFFAFQIGPFAVPEGEKTVLWVTAWSGWALVLVTGIGLITQCQSNGDLSARIQKVEDARVSEKRRADEAERQLAATREKAKRDLASFAAYYKTRIADADDALRALDKVESNKVRLKGDYQVSYDGAYTTWKGKLAAMVALVEKGREVLGPLGKLLDGNVTAIENSLYQADEQTLRRYFEIIRDNADATIDSLNRALDQLPQPSSSIGRLLSRLSIDSRAASRLLSTIWGRFLSSDYNASL